MTDAAIFGDLSANLRALVHSKIPRMERARSTSFRRLRNSQCGISIDRRRLLEILLRFTRRSRFQRLCGRKTYGYVQGWTELRLADAGRLDAAGTPASPSCFSDPSSGAGGNHVSRFVYLDSERKGGSGRHSGDMLSVTYGSARQYRIPFQWHSERRFSDCRSSPGSQDCIRREWIDGLARPFKIVGFLEGPVTRGVVDNQNLSIVGREQGGYSA
jgi:hypothetical protein